MSFPRPLRAPLQHSALRCETREPQTPPQRRRQRAERTRGAKERTARQSQNCFDIPSFSPEAQTGSLSHILRPLLRLIMETTARPLCIRNSASLRVTQIANCVLFPRSNCPRYLLFSTPAPGKSIIKKLAVLQRCNFSMGGEEGLSNEKCNC